MLRPRYSKGHFAESQSRERVLESTLRMASNEFRHRARLVEDYGEVPPVEANEGRLGQVFLNLIVNATQAITEVRADQNEIRITTRQTDCIAVYAPRPFGCERPMNRATDLDGLFAAISERSRTCRACSHC